MLSNYLRILVRFMAKRRGFSFINVAGLTIGIASSLLILLYIQDELAYDRFHEDADRIYRVGFSGTIQGAHAVSARTGLPLASAIEKIKGVQSAIRIASWKTFPVRYEHQTYTEDHLLLSDPHFFRFFSFRLLEGHPDSVLLGDGKVVLTESAARRYFNYTGKGDRRPIGKSLVFAQGARVTVSGIAADPPVNSHFHFSLILSLSTWKAESEELSDWISGMVFTYYKILPGAPQDRVEDAIIHELHDNLSRQLETLRQKDLEAFKRQGNDLGYFIQPLNDIRLRSNLPDEIETNGTLETLVLFGAIALFITALACINFMNLTTAQSAARAKEIAVRKTAGANHDRLVGQFLLESYFWVILGAIHAIVVVMVALAPFNHFTGKQIPLSGLFTPGFLAGITVFVLATGLVAGSYPAFYLTSFSPVDVMKGNLRAKIRTYGIRNVLVVFQFFISASLIIATLVVYQQLRFLQHADLGFDKSNVINLLHTRNLGDNTRAFKDALLKTPGVVSASYCDRVPPNIEMRSVFRPSGSDRDYLLVIYEMDEDHLKTMGYKMVAGRFFDATIPEDRNALILNETAARRLGITDLPGEKFVSEYDVPPMREREVIGIMQDFNYRSLREAIQPMAIIPATPPFWEMAIRIRAEGSDSTLVRIRKLWTSYAPDAPFEYSFIDKNFEAGQASDKKTGVLFLIFTVLAIVIACLGLFGLATFTAEQKRKQIGIRKVLGATTADVLTLLNTEFMRLVLIANLLACPITGWLMHQWLANYAYHTGIPWWIFALAILITSLIALFTISFRSYQAANVNPVQSLRSE